MDTYLWKTKRKIHRTRFALYEKRSQETTSDMKHNLTAGPHIHLGYIFNHKQVKSKYLSNVYEKLPRVEFVNGGNGM